MTKIPFPDWIRAKYPQNEKLNQTVALLDELRLHTVCQSARCPNQGGCFADGTATFLILGNICTRSCRFCAVNKGKAEPLDEDEPHRVAEAVKRMKLDYVVITSVTRDDLADGGAAAFAETIRQIRTVSSCMIEILTPDFMGNCKALQIIADAQPTVFNHNVETIPRLYPVIRPQADYQRSLWVLLTMRNLLPQAKIKSGLMVGFGERKEEVVGVLEDLRKAGCDFITIGQYLAPSTVHHPVVEFIHPEKFTEYEQIAQSLGFTGVASGPLVRSSYHAKKIYENACSE